MVYVFSFEIECKDTKNIRNMQELEGVTANILALIGKKRLNC